MARKNIIAAILILALLLGFCPAFAYAGDAPSDWAREDIAESIAAGKVPEKFQRDYQRPITVGEYAELSYAFGALYGENDFLSKIKIIDSAVHDDSPGYIKKAFVTGLIDDVSGLDKTMTREEAALWLVQPNTNLNYGASKIDTTDYNSISLAAMDAVGTMINEGYIPTPGKTFNPKSPFTVEQAIVGLSRIHTDYLRGLFPQFSMDRADTIVVEKNRITMDFSDSKDYENYIYSFVRSRLDDLEISGANQRFDVGYMIIELNPADLDVRYTMKNEICNVLHFGDFDEQPTYGLDNYKSEPRELKPGETANLHTEPDSIHKKLYAKVDGILKKIITPGMKMKEKIKTIHDYVVNNITYSGEPKPVNGETALLALETKKGVCGYYAALFYYLCSRAQIPVKVLNDRCLTGPHAWNVVYVDNQWLHVDTTWDDPKNKINYDYYLKSAEYMADTHQWTGFDYPAYYRYPAIDGMSIKTTLELRVFLMQQLTDGTWKNAVTFKLLNKNINKSTRFLKFFRYFKTSDLKYDAKLGLYTLKFQE